MSDRCPSSPLPSAPQALLQWHAAQQLWRRRSALVAFAKLAKAGDGGTYPGFKEDLLAACGSLVQSQERFHQTGRCLGAAACCLWSPWSSLPAPHPPTHPALSQCRQCRRAPLPRLAGTGWVLRELGKGDQDALVRFCRQHAGHFSAEGLRYAMEKLPAALRKELQQLRKGALQGR